MLRKTIIALTTIAAAALTTAATPLATSGSAGGTAPAEDRATAGITVVGEAIYAPSAFERAVTPKLAAAAVNVACQDSAYALAAWRLPSTFRWSYNQAGVPASISSTALAAVRNATTTMFKAAYACGGTTDLGISEQYLGISPKKAQVSATASCTGNDGANVVSWGPLPSNILAYTCVYYRTSSKAVLSSDTLINNSVHKWFTTLPVRCSNQFDLQSVMVHERGHTAGLEHVDSTHASQAMNGRTPACSTARRVLGAGDVKGLKTKYLG